jgi:hypothetical protein
MEYKSLKVISVKIRQSWNATGTRGRLLEIYLVFARLPYETAYGINTKQRTRLSLEAAGTPTSPGYRIVMGAKYGYRESVTPHQAIGIE